MAVNGMNPAALHQLAQQLACAPACMVVVHATQGSAPREAGAWMAVFADHVLGTVGGGHLEWDAIAQARALLLHGTPPQGAGVQVLTDEALHAPQYVLRYPLGPALGQCCGGVVQLRLQCVQPAQAAAVVRGLACSTTPVAVLGAGHVGQALVRLLATLPFGVTWVDSREAPWPTDMPPAVVCEHSDPLAHAVPTLAPGSHVLVMSHNHAHDFDAVVACLLRQRQQGDLPFVGLIGSHSKWASFAKRLQARGFTPQELAHITCPIGLSGIAGKAPPVIAVAVAAQLLQKIS
jgi:xanthine dehydrogenase accessory factor